MNEGNPNTLPMRPVIHLEEFASAAGVCTHTVLRWVKKKTAPAGRKIGRRHMWPREVVANFLGLNSNTTSAM